MSLLDKVQALKAQHAEYLRKAQTLERRAYSLAKNNPAVMDLQEAGKTEAELRKMVRDWLKRHVPQYVDFLANLSIITFQLEELNGN